MKKLLGIFVFCFAIAQMAYGQKQTINQTLFWFNYNNTMVFNERWTLFSMVSQRMYINPHAQHQLVIRSMAKRKIDPNWEAVAGMTYFNQWANDPTIENEPIVPELRPHIEMGNKVEYRHFNIEQRYMMEARFFHAMNDDKTALGEGFPFGNLRFRYRIQIIASLLNYGKDKSIEARIGNELMLNAGSNITLNTFDQNRVFFSLATEITKGLAFEIGYLNWYQQTPAGTYFNRDILTTAIRHTIKLKEKEKYQ